ncbi:hypothetical protein HPB50_018378 [Hyalomma asiaticum]|uniref:Uncharacterized protein n=1 Tax=Hyalomma asiaticum TaxID=266040 RepID=A0ACB7TK91_HYAAI|nr:hypothetical protein HPB50_018378 [Hyalomma asiaticum]
MKCSGVSVSSFSQRSALEDVDKKARRPEVWVESGNLGSPNAPGVNPEAGTALAPDHSRAEGKKGEGHRSSACTRSLRFGFSFRVHFQVNAARVRQAVRPAEPSGCRPALLAV